MKINIKIVELKDVPKKGMKPIAGILGDNGAAILYHHGCPLEFVVQCGDHAVKFEVHDVVKLAAAMAMELHEKENRILH